MAVGIMWTLGVVIFGLCGHYLLDLDRQHNTIYASIGGVLGVLFTLTG